MISQDSIPVPQNQDDDYMTSENEGKVAKCSYQASSESDLRNQIKATHPAPCGYACTRCGQKFKQKINFMLHEKTGCMKKYISFDQPGPSNCDFEISEMGHSRSSSSKIDVLESRNNASHNGKKRSFRKCPQKKLLKCDLCDFECYMKLPMSVHKATHPEYETFKCPHCPFATVDTDHLVRHSSIHVENPFSCSLCKYTSRSSRGLQSHVHKKHLDVNKKQYSCSECSLNTEHEAFFKKHKLVHSTERPFECSKCTYRFYNKCELQRHFLGTHDSSRHFQCPYCPFTVARKSNLTRHLKRIHCIHK